MLNTQTVELDDQWRDLYATVTGMTVLNHYLLENTDDQTADRQPVEYYEGTKTSPTAPARPHKLWPPNSEKPEAGPRQVWITDASRTIWVRAHPATTSYITVSQAS